MSDWARDAVFYHIYPLGLCGAPHHNSFEGPPEPRLAQIEEWIPHLRELGVTALYLGPLLESSVHGYDTADLWRVDRRLGDEQTLKRLVAALHAAGIRVILDAVFHHVGRDFWAFRDVQRNGPLSPYCGWFTGIDFGRSSPYRDAFAYEGWNGNYDLVKLNLAHPDVRAHLLEAVQFWIDTWDIDGLRLDVAELLDQQFLRDLSAYCRAARPDFWLLGEAVHADYRRLASPTTLDSVTNYEAYKGLYSSLNDANYFEIAYALRRQFGHGGIYEGLPLYNFADNHDVDRVASTLRNPAHLYPLYALLFTMPGVPSLYYGSEWGVGGRKRGGDDWPLRPQLPAPQLLTGTPHPELAPAIARLSRIRHASAALRRGSYAELLVAPQQLAFERRCPDERVIVALNAGSAPVPLDLAVDEADGAAFVDLLNAGEHFMVQGGRLRVEAVPACWARILVRRS